MIDWITDLLAFAFPVLELYLLVAKRGRNPVRTGDEGTLRIVWMLIGGGCFTGFLVAANAPAFRWPGSLGIVLLADGLLVTGLALRIWAIVHLGKFFTVDVGIQREHRVVQDGPYRFVRHPSYSGAMLALTGLACLTFNWLGFLIIIGCSLAAYRLRIGVEEKVLLLNLGDDYRRYAAQTKRLIPGIF
ncbi:MAG TPA: isoprenylcysteine carboxylmethyltransferase family protein [Chthoniobacterales bacterium]